MKRAIVTLGLACLLLGMLSGCAHKTAEGAPLTVAVSIVPQATFVEAVAGDLVDVVVMIPPGYSPENYAPTPQQLADFSKASLYFAIGVPAEEAGILPKAESLNEDIKIVPLQAEVAQVYPPRMMEDVEHGHGGVDPHIWLSPKRVKVMIEAIARELGELDPEHADVYRQNTEDYMAQLDRLDEEIREILSGSQNRTIILYHPAFGYFADDYGLTMIALEQEGKSATAKDFQNALDIAKEEGIKVIFYQEEFDSRQADTFAAEIGGEAVRLSPLSPDYINNLKQTAEAFAGVK
jgi:zinc transport system substrate-binding protein